MKNNLIGDVEDRLVRYLSETYPGRVHDKHICDGEELVFPPDIGLFQDTGFQGYHPAGVHIYQPKKKPKGKELTPEEKAENTIISSIRILIEHIPTTSFDFPLCMPSCIRHDYLSIGLLCNVPQLL